jgi:hypothetical protein
VPDDVDAAERLQREIDEPFQVRRVRHISSYGERPQAVRLEFELLPAAREHRHVRALGDERIGRCEAQTGGGAGNDRRPAAQTEIHRGKVTDRLCG